MPIIMLTEKKPFKENIFMEFCLSNNGTETFENSITLILIFVNINIQMLQYEKYIFLLRHGKNCRSLLRAKVFSRTLAM